MAESIIRGNQNTTKLINWLKTSSVQYSPLSKRDERKMIEDNRHDRNKLNHMLFMHNMRLVFKMAKTYMSKTMDYDSLVQNGMHGLMEATTKFDLDRDIKFCTYAATWIKKRMTMDYYSSQFKVDRRTISLNAPVNGAEYGEDGCVSADETVENFINTYADLSCGDQASRDVVDDIGRLECGSVCNMLYDEIRKDSSLSSVDKDVFVELFKNQEKTRDVAFKYGLEMSEVNEIRRRVLDKLKSKLQSVGIESCSDLM